MRAHLATAGWALLTGLGLLAPEPQLARAGTPPEWLPPVAHLGLFVGMAWLLCRSLGAMGGGPLRRRQAAAAFAIAVLYGLLLEVGQLGIEGRDFDWWDLVANGIGALAGVVVAALLARSSDRSG